MREDITMSAARRGGRRRPRRRRIERSITSIISLKEPSGLPLILTSLLSLVVAVQGQQPNYAPDLTINTLVTRCPNDRSQSGYTSIADMEADQDSEVERIFRGQAPRGPYIFPICPGTELDTSAGALNARLSNVTYACGNRGDVTDNCLFVGGTNQVVVPRRVTGSFTFVGISFSRYTGVAIAESSQEETTFKFQNVRWFDFEGPVIRAEDKSTLVYIENSVILNGKSDQPLFKNHNGDYVLDDVLFRNVTVAMALVASSPDAVIQLSNIAVTESFITSVFCWCYFGSSVLGTNITLSENTRMPEKGVFNADYEGSSILLTDIEVSNNEDFSNGWTVLYATDSAQIVAERVRVLENNWLQVSGIAVTRYCVVAVMYQPSG